MIQRYEGRTADGQPLPHVVWVAFGRNSSDDPKRIVGSVQFIGYNQITGATAFFESSDRLKPWVTIENETLRMRGEMPWIDDPEAFNRAFRTPGAVQCVRCHQADPFITNDFITSAKKPGTDEPVIPILDENSPYYVLGGENWDMRTLHIEDNGCFDCHRVGMSTVELFRGNGWHPEKYMPPDDPGSLQDDWEQLIKVWRSGPEKVEGAEWVIPPAKGEDYRIVGNDYPNKAAFNRPGNHRRSAPTKKGVSAENDNAKSAGPNKRALTAAEKAEAKKLLGMLEDADTRAAFEDWIEKVGMTPEVLDKLRLVADGKDR